MPGADFYRAKYPNISDQDAEKLAEIDTLAERKNDGTGVGNDSPRDTETSN